MQNCWTQVTPPGLYAPVFTISLLSPMLGTPKLPLNLEGKVNFVFPLTFYTVTISFQTMYYFVELWD